MRRQQWEYSSRKATFIRSDKKNRKKMLKKIEEEEVRKFATRHLPKNPPKAVELEAQPRQEAPQKIFNHPLAPSEDIPPKR